MVQAEVADRLVAMPGGKEYGIPSLKLAWWARSEKVGSVGPSVFWPAPRVDSGLVSFTRVDPPQTTASRQDVFAVIDQAFAQRRKTLRAALSSWAGSAMRSEEILLNAGISPQARGEELELAAFVRIAEAGITVVQNTSEQSPKV
jgi:16S rRNA (adenine1518-N6/adenine1519-N6)-dimethyltransferase